MFDYKITLNLRPFSKERPRQSKGKSYHTKRYKEKMKEVEKQIKAWMEDKEGLPIEDKAIKASVHLYYPDKRWIADVDNACPYFDVMNERVFEDDKQITELKVKRHFPDISQGRVEIYLTVVAT